MAIQILFLLSVIECHLQQHRKWSLEIFFLPQKSWFSSSFRDSEKWQYHWLYVIMENLVSLDCWFQDVSACFRMFLQNCYLLWTNFVITNSPRSFWFSPRSCTLNNCQSLIYTTVWKSSKLTKCPRESFSCFYKIFNLLGLLQRRCLNR